MIKIIDYSEAKSGEVFKREFELSSVENTVKEIIASVKLNGDGALKEYTKRFDRFLPSSLELSEGQIEEAYKRVDEELISALNNAADNIRAFHSKQKREGFELKNDGAIVGQRILPLERVGIYVPGGKAAYPSTVLMNAIPAKIAGVSEIVMVTPTPDGIINDKVIAAAKIAGVDRIFTIGGAQAVAALCYGTESVPKVNKIVGPGNAFVAEAKKQIFGICGIDMLAGPSEILIISDGKGCAERTAADMLSQAEHDENAAAVLVTTSSQFADAVAIELDKQLKTLTREKIATSSIEVNGKIILAASLEEAIEIANRWAPEHLELDVDEPFKYLEKIKNAGSVFLGRNTPEPVGDYYAGANHTLPTGGTATFSSPLSVDDFVKKMQYVYYSEEKIKKEAESIALFANAEGLTAHAASVLKRK